MSDPTLLARPATISVAALVMFGESDRVVTSACGRATADAIPGAKLVEIAAAGHLPHLENANATWVAIDSLRRTIVIAHPSHYVERHQIDPSRSHPPA